MTPPEERGKEKSSFLFTVRHLLAVIVVLPWLYFAVRMIFEYLNPSICEDFGCRKLGEGYNIFWFLMIFIISFMEYGVLGWLIWPQGRSQLISKRTFYYLLVIILVLAVLTFSTVALWDFPTLYIIHYLGLLLADCLWICFIGILLVGLAARKISNKA